MHQAHNIPWDTIPRHLKVKQLSPYLEGKNGTNIFRTAVSTTTKGLPSEHDEMNHFLRKFINAIHEFSCTERAKYPANPKITSTGRLFPDEILQKYRPQNGIGRSDHNSVNPNTQQISYWIQHIPNSAPDHINNTHSSKCAEVVKVLLDENSLDALLMLANHPSCSLSSIYSFGQGWNYGWCEFVEMALELYIFVNLVCNTPALLADARYARTQYHVNIVERMLHRSNHGHDSVPHDEFWDGRTRAGGGPLYGLKGPISDRAQIVDFFQDPAALKEYLKRCWRLIYCSDMLMRECGVEAEWEVMIVRVMRRWGFEGKYREMWRPSIPPRGPEDGCWISAYPNEFGPGRKGDLAKRDLI